MAGDGAKPTPRPSAGGQSGVEEPGAWSVLAFVLVGLVFLLGAAAVVHSLIATFA